MIAHRDKPVLLMTLPARFVSFQSACIPKSQAVYSCIQKNIGSASVGKIVDDDEEAIVTILLRLVLYNASLYRFLLSYVRRFLSHQNLRSRSKQANFCCCTARRIYLHQKRCHRSRELRQLKKKQTAQKQLQSSTLSVSYYYLCSVFIQSNI